MKQLMPTDTTALTATQSVLVCRHEWTDRDQGHGFKWSECWLCGEMSDYR